MVGVLPVDNDYTLTGSNMTRHVVCLADSVKMTGSDWNQRLPSFYVAKTT